MVVKPSSETRRIGTDQDFIGFYARIEESLPSNTIVLDISITSVCMCVFFFLFYVIAKRREEKKISNFFHVYKYPYLRTCGFTFRE